MSVVMAVKQGDRIWFGTDTQSTRGTERFNLLCPNDFKVLKLENGMLISWTGEGAAGQVVCSHLEHYFTAENKELTKEYLVTQIVPKLYQVLDEEGLLENEEDRSPQMPGRVLLAQKDKMYDIQRDFQVARYEDYQATGSGANSIIYGLSKIDKNKNINRQLLRLLRISAQHDSNVSAPFVLIDTKELEYTIQED